KELGRGLRLPVRVLFNMSDSGQDAYQGGEQVFPEQTLSGGLQAGPVDAGPADVPPVIQSFEEAENPGASGEIEAASV
ncbi:unnamed protein product, partial [Pylaiella littoralis]